MSSSPHRWFFNRIVLAGYVRDSVSDTAHGGASGRTLWAKLDEILAEYAQLERIEILCRGDYDDAGMEEAVYAIYSQMPMSGAKVVLRYEYVNGKVGTRSDVVETACWRQWF